MLFTQILTCINLSLMKIALISRWNKFILWITWYILDSSLVEVFLSGTLYAAWSAFLMTASIKSSSALVTVHNKIVRKRYFIIFPREKKGENITETYQGINNVSGRSIILNFRKICVTEKRVNSEINNSSTRILNRSDLTTSTIPNELKRYRCTYSSTAE